MPLSSAMRASETRAAGFFESCFALTARRIFGPVESEDDGFRAAGEKLFHDVGARDLHPPSLSTR